MIQSYPRLLAIDHSRLLNGLSISDWQFFKGCRFFITGGSGFIGKWLLSSLLHANKILSLGCTFEILSRNPNNFIDQFSSTVSSLDIILHQGDVRTFLFPSGQFDIVIHAATDVVLQSSPLELYGTCVDGTRRVLEFARHSNSKHFLLASSGAIYGQHPPRPIGFPEHYHGSSDCTNPSSAYSEGKRASEFLACAVAAESCLRVAIARIYSQVGPFIPLDKHFAIGNFIHDALSNRDILIRGDGTDVRSYLYAADTVTWLLSLIMKAESGTAWNIGGLEPISILDLARRVTSLLNPDCQIIINNQSLPSDKGSYVADCRKIRSALSLPEPLSLDESILRTANWLKQAC